MVHFLKPVARELVPKFAILLGTSLRGVVFKNAGD